LLASTPTPARAASDPGAVAEQLHLKAREAYQAKQLKRAIELWREAYDTHAEWKYAYNLANALREDGQYVQAWDYVTRAEELGVPSEYSTYLLDLRSFIRAELTKDHALLTLTVDPPDAQVVRNDNPWQAPEAKDGEPVPPRASWTKDTVSELVITRDGYITQKLTWKHGMGVHERRIALRPVPKPGTLTVNGTPVGAVIVLDDKPVGSIPDLSLPVEPGKHELVARAPGFVTERRPITIESERELRIDFTLKPVVVQSDADLATPGWVSIGSGAALLLTGAGFLMWADSTSADITKLNESAPGSIEYPAYEDQYNALKSDFDTRRDAGAVFVGIGAAAALTGIVLVVIDATSDSGPEPNKGVVPIAVSPLPGGAAFTGEVRF